MTSATLPERLDQQLDQRLEEHRGDLTRYCRWRLRSDIDAEDAVQETLLKAWRALDRFEGRAALRTWLFRIAGNVCVDMLVAQGRRGPVVDAESSLPLGDSVTGPTTGEDEPGDTAVVRDDVRLAFVATLLHLPPRQRSALILCDALRWRASEVADLLGMSVAAVNSALQRARATTAARRGLSVPPPARRDAEQSRAADHFLDALGQQDVDGLLALLGNPPSGR